MKKILSLVVLVAAVAMVGCGGGQKKAEDKGCSCCPKTECVKPACPQGEKNCAECPQKATCPQVEKNCAECPQKATCPQGEKNCAECPQKATCPHVQTEAAPAATPAQ